MKLYAVCADRYEATPIQLFTKKESAKKLLVERAKIARPGWINITTKQILSRPDAGLCKPHMDWRPHHEECKGSLVLKQQSSVIGIWHLACTKDPHCPRGRNSEAWIEEWEVMED